MRLQTIAALVALALTVGCASGGARTMAAAAAADAPAPAAAQDNSGIGPQYPSTYKRHPNPPVLIRNATIMTAAGQEIQGGSILFKDGRIVAVGTNVQAPTDATVVDGTGKWVTPGVIDTHSHIGVFAAPGTFGESDGNEATNPVTAEVWAEHSFWPQDPQIPLAIGGGVTTIQALPGSANLIGGRSAVLKLIPARSVQEMKFPGAHYGLKMACGENPKRTYGPRGGPSTRMGNMAGYRDAFIQAQAYRRKWDKWKKDHQGDPLRRCLRHPAAQSGSGEGDVPRPPRGDSHHARSGGAVVHGKPRLGARPRFARRHARARENGGRRHLVGRSALGVCPCAAGLQ